MICIGKMRAAALSVSLSSTIQQHQQQQLQPDRQSSLSWFQCKEKKHLKRWSSWQSLRSEDQLRLNPRNIFAEKNIVARFFVAIAKPREAISFGTSGSLYLLSEAVAARIEPTASQFEIDDSWLIQTERTPSWKQLVVTS